MENLADKTLAQIVTDNYKAAQVFEKYALDFCCKGKVALSKVCVDKHIEMDVIERELNDLDETNTDIISRFNAWQPSFLVDYIIENHHNYVKEAMDRLIFYTTKISRVHGDRHPELKIISVLFDEVVEELQAHMMKEEDILFPYIKRMDSTLHRDIRNEEDKFVNIENPLHIMEEEHETVGNLMSEIHKLSHNFTPPEDACNTYRVTYAELKEFEKDLHQHIHLENNILFPKARLMDRELREA